MISNNTTSGNIVDSGSSKHKSYGAARLALLSQLTSIDPSFTKSKTNYYFGKSCGTWYHKSDGCYECLRRRLVLWFKCNNSCHFFEDCASVASCGNVFGICSFERVYRSNANFTGFFILVPYGCNNNVYLDEISAGEIVGFFELPSTNKKTNECNTDKRKTDECDKNKCITDKEKLREKLDSFSSTNTKSESHRKAADKKFKQDPSPGQVHVSNDASQPGGEVNKALKKPNRKRARLEPGSCLSSKPPSSGTVNIPLNKSSSCVKSDIQAENDSESNSSKCGDSNSPSCQNGVSDYRAQGDLPGSEYVKGGFLYKDNVEHVQQDATNANCSPTSCATCFADDNYLSSYCSRTSYATRSADDNYLSHCYQDAPAEDFSPHMCRNIAPSWADPDSYSYYNKFS